jgi:hypothetical protein
MDDIAMPFSDPNPLLNPAAVASHEARAAGFLEVIRQEQARLWVRQRALEAQMSAKGLRMPVLEPAVDAETLKRSQAAVRRLRRML